MDECQREMDTMSLGHTISSTGEACPLEGVPRGHSSRDVCAVHIKGTLPTSSCLARDTHHCEQTTALHVRTHACCTKTLAVRQSKAMHAQVLMTHRGQSVQHPNSQRLSTPPKSRQLATTQVPLHEPSTNPHHSQTKVVETLILCLHSSSPSHG